MRYTGTHCTALHEPEGCPDELISMICFAIEISDLPVELPCNNSVASLVDEGSGCAPATGFGLLQGFHGAVHRFTIRRQDVRSDATALYSWQQINRPTQYKTLFCSI